MTQSAQWRILLRVADLLLYGQAGQPYQDGMDTILIDLDDAAAALAITPRRLKRLARAGRVPSVDLDGELRFSPAALRRWAEEQDHRESSTAGDQQDAQR